MSLLTLDEVATALGVSLGKVRKLVEGGDLASVKLGTARKSPRRVKPSDLAAYVRSCRTSARSRAT